MRWRRAASRERQSKEVQADEEMACGLAWSLGAFTAHVTAYAMSAVGGGVGAAMIRIDVLEAFWKRVVEGSGSGHAARRERLLPGRRRGTIRHSIRVC